MKIPFKQMTSQVQFRCHTCKQFRHFSKSCPNKSYKKPQESKKQLFCASLIANKNTDIFIDSGASQHMINNSAYLHNVKKSV